jgi:hypothetical protein
VTVNEVQAARRRRNVVSLLVHLAVFALLFLAVTDEDGLMFLLAVALELIYWMVLHRRLAP